MLRYLKVLFDINFNFLAEFDIKFYSQFDLVFCALDNNAAREHLSLMCIRSNKIMIDAGTGGFNG
jgi:ubiquitin-like 1-activating enzyme E1 B